MYKTISLHITCLILSFHICLRWLMKCYEQIQKIYDWKITKIVAIFNGYPSIMRISRKLKKKLFKQEIF